MTRTFKENWIQPLFFLGNNPISLIGVGLTSASALTLIGFFFLKAHFFLWMAGVGSAALVLAGLWLKQV